MSDEIKTAARFIHAENLTVELTITLPLWMLIKIKDTINSNNLKSYYAPLDDLYRVLRSIAAKVEKEFIFQKED